jgi:chromosomal replication initiator protein
VVSDRGQRLVDAIRTAIPVELAEVLLPVLKLRITGARVVAVLPNRIWLDAFRIGAQDAAERAAAAAGLAFSAVAREDAAVAEERTFDGFVADPGNQLALTACRRVLREPGLAHNPLFLHGPSGCGKSHLLNALAGEFSVAAGADGAALFTGDEFVARWTQVLAGREGHPLKDLAASAVLVACDGVDALAGRPLAQEQFFLLINEAIERGQQVVVAGRVPPQRLPEVEDRLTTRLGWGLAVAIETPLVETRLAVLRRRSTAAADMEAGELARLVESFAPDMHGVVELAARLDLGDRPGTSGEEASFDRILQAVAERYEVRANEITGAGRTRQVARARQAALLMGRRLTSHSLEALGNMVGGRDHSTVMYGIRQAEERAAADPEFARDIELLTRQVMG